VRHTIIAKKDFKYYSIFLPGMLKEHVTFPIFFIAFVYFVFRVIIKRDYTKHKKLSPVSILLELLVFAIHANSIYIFLPTEWPNLPHLPENKVLIIISTIILSSGIIILFYSWLNLGTKPSLGLDKNKLISKGFYSYSRNPQLLGYGLILITFVILYFSWLILFWLLQYILISYFMIKTEEEFLRQKYKEKYTDYCLQVPRIIKFKK